MLAVKISLDSIQSIFAPIYFVKNGCCHFANPIAFKNILNLLFLCFVMLQTISKNAAA